MAMIVLLALAAAPGLLCSGRLLRGDVSDGMHSTRVPLALMNDNDVSVYASITVGGSPTRCIMDTGSSEQVVFSSDCKTCGKHMYNCDKDDQCSWGQHTTVQSYGSGDTYSKEAHTGLTATALNGKRNITVENQMVWLVTDAQLDFDLDGTMQCIFGLGPAESAVEFAKMDYHLLEEYMSDMPKEDADQLAPTLKDLKSHIKFMKGVSLWQEAVGFDTMSFCLHPEFGKDGRLFINDDAPEAFPDAFVKTKAAGLYWQTDMAKVKIPFEKTIVSACKSGGTACAAIMDTGTSLIGAPWEFVSNLSDALSESMPKLGCEPDALDKYPDFEFTLDGHTFLLPPRSYVCKFAAADWEDEDEATNDGGNDYYNGDLDGADWGDDGDLRRSGGKKQILPHVRERMRHVRAFKEAHERFNLEASQASNPGGKAADDYFCAPCFFDLEQEQEGVEEWLFGLPFFREYYTTFRTNKEGTQAQNMFFAKGNAECQPGANGHEDDLKRGGVLRVNMPKLRLPSKSSKNRQVRNRNLLDHLRK